jgi:hypothetical protein
MKSVNAYSYTEVNYREFSLKTKSSTQQLYVHPDGFRYWTTKSGDITGRNKRTDDISTYQIVVTN